MVCRDRPLRLGNEILRAVVVLAESLFGSMVATVVREVAKLQPAHGAILARTSVPGTPRQPGYGRFRITQAARCPSELTPRAGTLPLRSGYTKPTSTHRRWATRSPSPTTSADRSIASRTRLPSSR